MKSPCPNCEFKANPKTFGICANCDKAHKYADSIHQNCFNTYITVGPEIYNLNLDERGGWKRRFENEE